MLKSIILSLSLLLTPAIATANCEKEKEQIQDCEALLEKADRVIDIQATTIRQLDAHKHAIETQLDYVTNQLAQERAKQTLWYKDPSFVLPAGLVTGIIIGALAVRGR